MSIFNRRNRYQNSDNDDKKSENDDMKKEVTPEKGTDNFDEQAFVELFDASGQPVRILKKQWFEQVLPNQIQQRWDDPDALYGLVIQAVQDGFSDSVQQAALRLKEIDRIPERASTTLAIVYMKTNQHDKAEQELMEFINTFGKTGIIMTNLAKVYSEKGMQEESDKTLWEALCIDPNQDNGLPWWVLRQKEKNGGQSIQEMLERACKIKDSWLPQVYLAATYLEKKNLDAAMALYRHAIPYSRTNRGVLYRISGDLGRFGYEKESIQLIAPLYSPDKDDIRTGLNLTQAYYKLRMKKEGLEMIELLKKQPRLDIQPFISDMTEKFNNLGRETEGIQQKPSNVKFSLSMFEKPVWYYGLSSPNWLVPEKKEAMRIGILSFSDLSPEKTERVEVTSEEGSGRLSRSFPLLMHESLLYFSNYDPIVIIPVAVGIGPVVSKTNTEKSQLKILAETNHFEKVITGSVCIDNSLYIIETQMYDVKKDKIEAVKFTADKDDFGLRVREHLILVHEKLSAPLQKNEDIKEGIYSLPNVAILKDYLLALSQSLVQTLAVNKMVDPKTIWGERNILNGLLKLASANPQNQVLEAIFVSSLAKSKNYGSDLYKEYQRSALALLRANLSDAEQSPFLPLIYHTYLRSDEFEKSKKKANTHPMNPQYLEWVNRIEKELSK